MNCKHVEKMMDDYMSGQIEPLVKEMIDRHLQDCETCRGNFLKARSVSDFLRQAEPSGPENSISGDLLNRLRDIDRENTDASVPPAGQRIS
ncbi:zf-HC2 domain-containing protein, partial [bacterium]|nr:zf-HC2 domain-containing protein [candidate division CSSED10-310 bacterium]